MFATQRWSSAIKDQWSSAFRPKHTIMNSIFDLRVGPRGFATFRNAEWDFLSEVTSLATDNDTDNIPSREMASLFLVYVDTFASEEWVERRAVLTMQKDKGLIRLKNLLPCPSKWVEWLQCISWWKWLFMQLVWLIRLWFQPLQMQASANLTCIYKVRL